MYYEKEDNALLGALTIDYKIAVQNLTNDKLHVFIDYYANTVCGQKSHRIGSLGNGIVLKPGEKIDRTWLSDGHNTYQRLIYDTCPKSSWREVGKDREGNKLFSLINSLGYSITKIVNLSEEERQKAEEKKRKEEEERNKKEEARKQEEAKKAKEAEERRLKEEEVKKATEAKERKLREEEGRRIEEAKRLKEMQKDEDDRNAAKTDAQQQKDMEQRRQEETKREREAEERQKQNEENERLKARNEEDRIRKEKADQIAKEDEGKKPCHKSYVLEKSRWFQSNYNHYKKNKNSGFKRADLMTEARNILLICPYNLAVEEMLADLQKEEDQQIAMINSLIDNAVGIDIEISRSIVSEGDMEGSLSKEMGILFKAQYASRNVSFIIGAGVSFVTFPSYVFTYSDSKNSSLPNKFPKENVPYAVGNATNIDGVLGVGFQIPLLKNNIKGYAPKLAIPLEVLGIVSYIIKEDNDFHASFPDVIDVYNIQFRASTGISFLVGKNSNLKLMVGMDKHIFDSEISGFAKTDEGSVYYNAEILNFKSLVPFVSLGFQFGL